MANVAYAKTADGDLAARVAHLVIALVPMKDGTMRTLTAWPPRDPATCNRSDFSNSGFAANDESSFRTEVQDFADHLEQVNLLNRRIIPQADLRQLHTPWGAPDSGKIYAEGVLELSTPGHGGFILNAEMNALVDDRWRIGAEGDGAPYEEDSDWAIVAFTFPQLFTTREKRAAERTLIHSYPDQWEAITGKTILPGQSSTRDQNIFMATHKGRWMGRAAIRSKIHEGKTLVTATIDCGPPDARARLYLVDSDRYDANYRGPGIFAFLVDESIDQLVNHREELIAA